MMIYAALRLGLETVVMDPDPECPCAGLAGRFFTADLGDAEAIRRLAGEVDIVTYEIEHVNTDALREIAEAGTAVLPSPESLAVIQDKREQRARLSEHGLPGPRWGEVDGPQDPGIEAFGFPSVQKLRRGGYDGRGVAVLRDATSERLEGPSLLEEKVDVEQELSVVCVRDRAGYTDAYPVTRMEFDPEANICTRVYAPADVPESIAARAREVALRTVAALDLVGTATVELFLTRAGEILVNEVAPRPHNSGHLTIDAADTCQFEQHLRAVCGMPLGSTRQHSPAAMVNLLAEPGATGEPLVSGYARAMAIPGLSLHLYGKNRVKSRRKMGHATVIAAELERARELADQAAGALRIHGTDATEGREQ
jgi:5-(carboxyamino)imidazole ribonucleotide synthase